MFQKGVFYAFFVSIPSDYLKGWCFIYVFYITIY